MPSQARARRVGERIQQELADLLLRAVADPRLNMVTITGVDVDRELAFATIYVTAGGETDRSQEILAGLESARGFLRTQLAARIQLRSFPQLRFKWDTTLVKATRIEELLDQIKREKNQDAEHGSDEG